MLADSILHSDTCPMCEQGWEHLLNDLERLAHLIVCAQAVVRRT